MERINVKRNQTSDTVNKIINSLTTALEGLSMDDGDALSHDDLVHVPTSSLYHGQSFTAIHPSLLELYNLPFTSICFAAINGDEKMYCNKQFEKYYFTSEESSRRLLQGGESPRDIMSRLVDKQ